MKKLFFIILFYIIHVPSNIWGNDATPAKAKKCQYSSSLIDMDAFDAFIEKMKEADESGNEDLCSEVNRMCKDVYSPSEIRKANNPETQAYLARLYDLGVVCKRFGYKFERNSKKAYNYYIEALGGKTGYLIPAYWKVQVAYRMGIFMLKNDGLDYIIKDLSYERRKNIGTRLILNDMDFETPFYGYHPKAHLAARIVSGEEGSYENQPLSFYIYDSPLYSKKSYHPDIFKAAQKCYRIAAKDGTPEVQFEYADFLFRWSHYYGNGGYYFEDGVTINPLDLFEEGKYWYQQAATQGYLPGIVNNCFNNIKYINKTLNISEIKVLLQQAADSGDVVAMYNLSVLCSENLYGLNDYQTAVRYAKKGADIGHAGCATMMAYFYRNGIGVEKNQEEANHYAETASKPRRSQVDYTFHPLTHYTIYRRSLISENILSLKETSELE